MSDAQQPNISLTGDEARILIVALRTSNIGAPMGITVNLYLALNAISQVQPPRVQTNQGTSSNEEL
jgi:hypothetical protein